MAKKKGNSPYTEEEYQESIDPAFKALLIQQAVINGNNENPYELFNTLLKKQRSKRLYKSGFTKPLSSLALHLEAERDTQHSSKLWRNMKNEAKSEGETASKTKEHEIHHVVAARASDAHVSRRIIFGVGIGINDARNGINLQRAIHRPIHTDNYYFEVNFRLLAIEDALKTTSLTDKESGIEQELQNMALEIENGTF
jgi:hypothetical protein